ncbi:MAG: choice-of-anchor D domain-containing protein [Chloroflexota bacterium]|nr:MAG: choice-of-anchor D domain-containing protein [Chloroflexota bacterium]
MIGTSFIGNRANGSPGRGGAVYMSGSGSFSSEASTFTANKASTGGAIYIQKTSGSAGINDSIFTGNVVTGDSNDLGGGAIYNYAGIVEVQRSAFNANIGLQGQGGALVNNIGATAAITSTLFDGNLVGDTGAGMDGGAIKNMGILRVARSTFVSNLAQGGSGGAIAASANGTVSIANTTFSANTATEQGGALSFTGTTVAEIRNSTLENNSAGTAASAIYALNTSQVSIGNTIIDYSLSTQTSCSNTGITSFGHNLDRDGSCVSAASDLTGVDPKLGGLSFNGGALPVLTTHMPAYDSPAVDHGDPLICADPAVNNEDETGTKRPKDANHTGVKACDTGAVEVPARTPTFSAMPLPPGPLNIGGAEVNTVLTTDFTVSNPGNYKLTLSNPSLEDAAHFGLVTTFPVIVEAAQQATITLSCNPTSAGPLVTTFKFSTDDPETPEVAYVLACEGVSAPQPVFASFPALPAPFEFGVVTVGQIATGTFIIKNNGKAPLTITEVIWSGSGDIASNLPAAPFSIAPTVAQTFAPTCKPSQIGLLTGQLQLKTDDPSQPSVTFNLNCAGAPPWTANLVNSQNLFHSDLPADFMGPSGVAFSSDSQNAYVVGRATTTSGQIVVLKRGTLPNGVEGFTWTTRDTRIELYDTNSVVVSPDDKYVLATGAVNKAIVFYQRDSGSGDLTYLGAIQNGSNGVTGLDYPTDLAFSPDGQFVYVASYNGNSVVILKQDDAAITKFSFVGTVSATTDAAHPLVKPYGIAVSPDGKNVYVTAYTNDPNNTGTLAVYRRNPVSGQLTPIQTRWQLDTQDACSICFPMVGLRGAYGVAVSPDGGNVYVTGLVDGSLITFIREPLTGEVHLPYAFLTGIWGFSGLAGARGVTVSPGGEHVYVVGTADQTMMEFNRDLRTHNIFPSQVYTRDSSGIPQLGGVTKVAVSDDGQFVIATGSTDSGLAVFQVANPPPALFVLQPASVDAGASDVTLIVKGARFVEGAQVMWDGIPAETTYINETEVDAVIPQAWMASAGSHTIGVKNPEPGGGDSFNTLPFHVIEPANVSFSALTTHIPSIDHLTPAGAKAGSQAFVMDIYGTNFQSTSQVLVNNASLDVNFISSTHLQVTVSAGLMAQAGTLGIKVSNGASADSNLVGLFVSPPGLIPVPTILDLSPTFVLAPPGNGPSFTILITGSNFVEGATAQWNGSDRPVEFVDSTHLRVTIYGSDQLWLPSLNSLTVTNPFPGGGMSNVMSFNVYALQRIFLPYMIK